MEAFVRHPYDVLPLGRGIEDTADMYWDVFNTDNSVVIVRGIDLSTGAVNQRVTRWLLGPRTVSVQGEEGAN